MKTTHDEASDPAGLSRRALEDEIASTRADLGETVDALASRLDVKGRARESVTTATHRTAERMRARPWVPAAAAGVVAAVAVLVLWRRHR